MNDAKECFKKHYQKVDYRECKYVFHSNFSFLDEAIDKLIQSIEKLGCKIPNDFFECKDCGDLSMSGGFTVPMDGEINYKPKVQILFKIRKHLNYSIYRLL